MEKISLEEFHTRLKAQGLPREHLAFKCVMCGTVQSTASFAAAGAPGDASERYIGFSCIGRITNAGPHQKNQPPGRGCDWSLGGLFRIHQLEIIDADGKHHPHFELATAEEARALMESLQAPAAIGAGK
jgi:hypothetical protein